MLLLLLMTTSPQVCDEFATSIML